MYIVFFQGSEIMILPLIIMGGLLVAGGVASLLLPETLNQHLPQTLEDGEQMGLDTEFCCIPPTRQTLSSPRKKESHNINSNVYSYQSVELIEKAKVNIDKEIAEVDVLVGN